MMNLPLYSIDYIINDTGVVVVQNFYTTKAARDFLWNNRNKIHDTIIYLFGSMTEITEKDLRD